MNKKLLIFSLIVLISLTSLGFSAALIDDFEDGDYTNDPTWTCATGCSVITGAKYEGTYGLQIDGGGSGDYKATTLNLNNQSYFEWWVRYTTSNGGNMGIYLQNPTNSEDIRLFWTSAGGLNYRITNGDSGIITAGAPTINKWYKFAVEHYDANSSAIFWVYDSDGTSLLHTATATSGDAFYNHHTTLNGYKDVVNFDYVTYDFVLLVGTDLNVTTILDNSTNHFFKINEEQTLNFTAYNSSGSYLPLQALNITIPSMTGYSNINYTSGSAFPITFNNTNVWNYSVIVGSPYNSSIQETFNFYTINSTITNGFNNMTSGFSSVINSTITDKDYYPYTFNQYILWNNTYQTVTGTNPYYSTISAVDITPLFITSINISSILEATYLGEKINITTNNTQWILRLGIDNCSTYTTPFINFIGRDEITQDLVNISVNINFEFNNEIIHNSSFTNLSNQQYCYSPGTGTYNIEAELEYSGAPTTYTELRKYYLNNFEINNVVNTVNLYCLEDSSSDLLEFSIEDNVGIGLGGYYAQFNRWDVATSSYSGISNTQTNDNGDGNIYVNFYDTSYQVIISNTEGEVVKTFTKQTFTSSPVIFPISDDTGVEYDYWTNCFSSSIVWSNDTRIIATVTDSCGLNTELYLTIDKVGILSTSVECNKELTGSSSFTTYCDITNPTGTYNINVKALVDDNIIRLYSETKDYSILTDTAKGSGLFSTFLIVGILSSIGILISGSIGALLGILGLIGCYMLGLISMTFGSMIGIIVLFITLLVVLKR